jgi:hypothetical protein
MSSTTGTKNTAHKFALSASDICRILKECRNSGVHELVLQDFRVTFGSRRNENPDQPGPAPESNFELKQDPVFDASSTEARLMDEQTLLEAEEAQLLIDDPMAFERTQIDRHIERSRVAHA